MPQYPNPGQGQYSNFSNLANAMTTMSQGMGDNVGGQLAGTVGQALTGVGSALGKNKDAPADMSNVPMASGNFYQPVAQPARSQLLQAMMQRSRMGRNQGA